MTSALIDHYEQLHKSKIPSDRMPTEAEFELALKTLEGLVEFQFGPIARGVIAASEARRDFWDAETVGQLLIWVDRARDAFETCRTTSPRSP